MKKNVFLLLAVALIFSSQIKITKAGCCPANCSTVESSCDPGGWYSAAPDCSSITGCAPAGATTQPTSTGVNPDTGTTYVPPSGTSVVGADGWNIDELSDYGLPEASIYEIVTNFLYWILGILGIAGVIGFAISGVMYLLSAGNDTMTENAKKAMTASILGVIVGLSGLVVIRAIDWALNGLSFF